MTGVPDNDGPDGPDTPDRPDAAAPTTDGAEKAETGADTTAASTAGDDAPDGAESSDTIDPKAEAEPETEPETESAAAHGDQGPDPAAAPPAAEPRQPQPPSPAQAQWSGGPPAPGQPQYGPYPVLYNAPPGVGYPPYRPRPPKPRRPLPKTPRWLVPAALVAGLLTAILVPDERPGIGLAVAALVLGSAVLRAARGRFTGWTVAYGVLGCALLLVSVLLDAEWIVYIDLVAAFGLAGLAVSGSGRTWLGLLRGGVSVLIELPRTPAFLTAPLRGPRSGRRWAPILVSAAVTVVLAGLFGLLFASADPAFAHFAGRFFAFDALPDLPYRLFVFAVGVALVGAAAIVALRPVADPAGPKASLNVTRGVWAAPLIALNLLFLSFIAVQVSMLFGGNAHVLRSEDLTYAEYARQGFFQLATVSVLVLAVVALAAWILPRERAGDRKVQAVLLGLLCCLTLVVLASAMHRLGLYTDMFGLTRLRAAVGATLGWIGVVFLLVLAAGLLGLLGRSAAWLPRAAVLTTGLALAVFSFWNPDARIAESQVSRDHTPDTWYLATLSADAVPALDGLDGDARDCALRDIDLRLGDEEPWNAWNASRDRARGILDRDPPVQLEYSTLSAPEPIDPVDPIGCPTSRWDEYDR